MATTKKFLLKERRRSTRIEGRLPVTLVLRHGRLGHVIAGPAAGEVLDVSLYGAGLLLEQIRVENCHLFYSPQDNPSCVLHVEFVAAPNGETLSLPVRPVRFDRVLEEDASAKPFHLGVEFLLKPTEKAVRLLFSQVAEQAGGKGWWRKLVELFLPA